MTEATLTTKRFSEKRELLISTASTLFNEKGVVGTTLTEVGASIGLLKNSVTYYYRRKEDLALACFERAIRVYDELIAMVPAEGDVQQRVRTLFALHVTLHAEILQGTRPPIVAFHEIRALPEPQRSVLLSSYTSMYRGVRAILQSPQTKGWSRDHLNARAHLLISYLHGIKPLVERYEPEDLPRLLERFSDIVLHGMHAPNTPWNATGLEDQWLSEVPDTDQSAQFLRAATELINEQGYAGASVNRIAEKLNLTKGGFYYYNDNKHDLIAECFERSIATIRKAVNLTESYQESAWEHLCSIVRGLVRFQLSPDGPLLRATANSALPDAEHRAQVNRELGRITERISGVVVSALIAGAVRPVDPSLAARVILAGITAAAELRRWVPSAREDNATQLYAQPMLLGLLCDTME